MNNCRYPRIRRQQRQCPAFRIALQIHPVLPLKCLEITGKRTADTVDDGGDLGVLLQLQRVFLLAALDDQRVPITFGLSVRFSSRAGG